MKSGLLSLATLCATTVGCGSQVVVESEEMRAGDSVQIFTIAVVDAYCERLNESILLDRSQTARFYAARDSAHRAWEESLAVFTRRRDPARVRSAEGNIEMYRTALPPYSANFVAEPTPVSAVDWGVDKRITLPKRIRGAHWIKARDRWQRLDLGSWGSARVVSRRRNTVDTPCPEPTTPPPFWR